ncbi:MAG TPA: dTDP-glucose 4,6-dehydratase [Methylomirabilota bacterium]|jgi:dTDP-glucose 4,6-dehydratase|nr:dTDP-glucose 4,6-dehydratase [Methylomirabilota bacterium]
MRVLVTGGAGFIGSHFVRHLLTTYPEYEVVNLDKLTYAGNPANLAGLADHPRYRFVHGDICEPLLVREVMAGCDAVVNFAAESHVDRSIHDAGDFIRTDVFGTWVLLETARAHRIGRYLQVSTDEVYGSIVTGAFQETHPLRPSSPYSASKAGGDHMALAYWTTHRTPVVVTRASNNFGPNQYPEKVIPLFITNALDDLPLPLYGDGRHVRDWLYVLDHCAALDLVLHKGAEGEVYNVGGSVEVENIELTRRILALLGKPESLIRPVVDRPGHDRRYALDTTKLRALGWQPTYPFDDALAATVAWYREHEAWWRPLKSGEFLAYYRRQYGAR